MKDTVNKNRQNWDDYSPAYLRFKHNEKVLERIRKDPAQAFEKGTWQQIQRCFPDLKGKKVCVPSSGDNHAVFAFAWLGARVTSCDISEKQLAAAKQKAEEMSLDIRFVQADTMEMQGVEDGKYDMVYTSNGVHVWLDDLPKMYRNMHRILKKGGWYIMCDVHPFQRPFGNDFQVVKSYPDVGPFEDEYNITFAWRIQDMMNAMAESGLHFIHMEEMMDEKDYEYPFWLSLEDAVKGVKVDAEDVDRMYDWRQNPAMAIPQWLCVVCRKTE
ncbi:MAG: class I SAM-dependent methyltransferase [Clostridia bacterium]|nr:class I SAM-dependent methyltransferase [Clostridia bacterium]